MDTLAVMASISSQTGVAGALLTIAVLKARLTPLLLFYYLRVLTDSSPFKSAGSPSEAWRRSRFWKLYAEFFSASLIRTVAIDPLKGPFIFGIHPHGILALSAPAMFGSEATGFSEKYPGIDIRVAIVNVGFYLPIAREFALASGCISADRSSIKAALQLGKSVAVYVGGADEALLAGHPSQFGLVLTKRTGFVRLAVELGVGLIPCLTFGEHESYSQVFEPLIRKFQVHLMKLCGFSLPIFKPNYFVPLLPRKVKLTTVIGAPIAVQKLVPTDPCFNQAVTDTHARYVDALVNLHSKFRDAYGSHVEQSLTILDAQEARQIPAKL